jgi:tetratricopeptide (TPR) repeat protein
MRPFLLAAALLAVTWADTGLADQSDPRLDRLFQQLAAMRTPEEARDVEHQIVAIWLRSGSDTADLLMARAQSAVEADDFATAKKVLDAVAEMKPKYAEVWYRRAELLVLMDSQQEAAADLAKALELEPRHYAAWVASGRLADQAGDKREALAAYRKAVALDPMLESVARRAGQLTFEVEKKPPQ